MKDTAKVNAGKKKPAAGQTGKTPSQTTPSAAKKSTPKPDKKKPSKVSPKDKPAKPASATKSSPARKTGTPPKKTTTKTGTKAPSAKAKETSKPVKSSTKPASKTASNKASVAKAPVAKVAAAKVAAAKVAAAKTTAAKAATAKTSATKAAGAKAPVAKVPAAKVPAAKVPAAKVPAAKVPAAKVPFACYKGTRPYIFVSYSHKDMTEVFGTIKKLSESRYRLWYDEGIEPGFEWPEVVGKALTRCSQLIVFMSRTAAVSRNVRNEINLAFSEGKGILVVYLEKTKLTEGMKLQIGTVQFLNKYEMNAKEFVEKLKSVLSNDLHN